jgi:predicted acylesterase/phospholipase RssA
MARNHEPKAAFVLSGGASLGAIQVGMLHAPRPSQHPAYAA